MAKIRRKAIRVPKKVTMQFFDQMEERAKAGDERAEEVLRQEAAKLAKKINRQLREFENLGRASAARERVEYYLQEERGAARFSERTKTKNLDALLEDVEQMMIFQSAEGYSLKIAKKEMEQIDKLSKTFQTALGTDKIDDYVALQMNEMFKTEAWAEFRKSPEGGTNLIRSAQEAFKRGRTVDDLIRAYESFKERDSRLDLHTAWKKFTGGRWR